MKKILYWLLIIFSSLVLNSASIVFLVLYNTGLYTVTEGRRTTTYSNWTDLTFGEQSAVVIFMVIGAILTVALVKWVFKDTIDRSREKAKEKKQKKDNFDRLLKEI